MKRLQISDQELITVLRHMAPETLSLTCLGCRHERSCSIHGCAVLLMAADRLKELASPPNDPLTLEELQEMKGASRTKYVCAVTGAPCCWCNPGPCSSRKPEEGTI